MMTKLVPSEKQEQFALIEWAALTTIKPYAIPIGDYLFHIPNEGRRTSWQGATLVKMGLKAGVPDLFLAYPLWLNDANNQLMGYPGMFIEMKRRNLKDASNGGLTSQQKNMLTLLDSVGYRCIVAYGWEEARNAILEYLK